MTSALKAWGTTVSFDGVTIPEIMSINGTRTREMIDVFTCDSADEAVERLTSGLDEGSWAFTAVYQPAAAANYDILNDKYLQGRTGTLLITYATPSGASAPTLSVSGIITNLSIPQFGSAREIDVVEFSITSSGKATYTDSSGSTASASPSVSPSSSTSV